jgi:hypothetical protein
MVRISTLKLMFACGNVREKIEMIFQINTNSHESWESDYSRGWKTWELMYP